MKLAVDPQNVQCTEIQALADDDLINDLIDVLSVQKENFIPLKNIVEQVYDEFMMGYYEVDYSLPEHVEQAALMKVHDAASELHRSIMDLFEFGNADKRLAKALVKYGSDELELSKAVGVWQHVVNDWNPNISVRRLITQIQIAAKHAADLPNKSKTMAELQEELSHAQTSKEMERIESEMALVDFHDVYWPKEEQEKERKERVDERKVPKDLPIRNALSVMKPFFENILEIPFTAGKYYPEIGYNSAAFYAAKMVLKKIYPQISNRKIAGIMSEI